MDASWMEKHLMGNSLRVLYIVFYGSTAFWGLCGLIVDGGTRIAFLVIALICALIGYLAKVSSKRKYNKWLASIQQAGYLPTMLQDFDQAHTLMDGNIRLGRYWFFGKGGGKAYTYADMVKVYQYVHRTNFIEDVRQLRAVMRDGKEYTLCNLPRRGKADAELNRVLGIMHSHNPGIHFGYK